MGELQIQEGIIIDDIESVAGRIYELSGKTVKDVNVIATFIRRECNTIFYVDEKMNVKMDRDPRCLYVWLDTGYTDHMGRPILVSLLKNYGEYFGHYTGTVNEIARSNKIQFPRYSSDISRNQRAFLEKYEKKASKRNNPHILNEQEYLIGRCNEESGNSEFALKLQALDLDFIKEDVQHDMYIEEVHEEAEDVPALTEFEEELTIGLLMDKIEKMNEYVKMLQDTIETMNIQNSKQLAEISEKNAEYKRAYLELKRFIQDEGITGSRESNKDTADKHGHDVLGRNGKILILGASQVDENVMLAIAKKEFGFDKNDIEFEIDYNKVVSRAGRIQIDGRYKGIIFGCCPHKVAGLGDWTSIIEKIHAHDDSIISVDARCKAGGLKVTKESYRTALRSVVSKLMEAEREIA